MFTASSHANVIYGPRNMIDLALAHQFPAVCKQHEKSYFAGWRYLNSGLMAQMGAALDAIKA